jgi:hypothetical protein
MARKPIDVIKAAIARKRDAKRQAAQEIQHMIEHKPMYLAIVSCIELDEDNDYVIIGTDQVIFSLRELDGFKNARLVNGLSKIMDLPGICDRGTAEFPSVRNRDYKFFLDYLKSDGTSGKVWLQVSAYVKSDSAVCRRVQIGVKEEPIYGLECD